jgi:hypothetical protein
MSEKTCTVCKQSKPLGDYYNFKKSKDGKSWRCKECDKNTTIDSRRRRYEKSRVQQRVAQRKSKYGLTDEMFKELFSSQKGLCACCSVPLDESFSVHHARNKLVVDHCHETGIVRGLVCTMCNKGIGLLGDNAEGLYKAYTYLQTFENLTHPLRVRC